MRIQRGCFANHAASSLIRIIVCRLVSAIYIAPPEHSHAPLSNRASAKHAFLLIVGLVGIVLLAEEVAAGVEEGLAHFHVGQTDAIIGAFIATLALLPEAISAIQAAVKNELQRSLNIALGSALATIGLTIPAVAIATSILTGRELKLGLSSGDTVLLVLVLAVSTLSFGTGRTNLLWACSLGCFRGDPSAGCSILRRRLSLR